MTTTAEWFIPHHLGLDFIAGGTTTRAVGLAAAKSQTPYDKLNLGLHVGDNAERVLQNRQLMKSLLKLPSEPLWLEQTHGVETVNADDRLANPTPADASYSESPGRVLTVMSADCLPIILASEDADWVAVVHCGWRSLASNILSKTLNQTKLHPKKIRAWLGPAIGVRAFEVGEDVKQSFLQQWQQQPLPSSKIDRCFEPKQSGKYLADLSSLARLKLESAGLSWIKGGEYCTYTDTDKFFSYRRDGETGRMATLAWIK